jgi:hypothetical protein
MAVWEIRLVEQPPMRVEAEDGRNLAKEFTLFCEALRSKRRPRWMFWSKPESSDPYWVINDETKLHVQMVAGVLIMKPVRKPRDHKEIGFHVNHQE